MEVSSWKDKSLDEIELHTQKLIPEIANTFDVVEDDFYRPRLKQVSRAFNHHRDQSKDERLPVRPQQAAYSGLSSFHSNLAFVLMGIQSNSFIYSSTGLARAALLSLMRSNLLP
jgi:hypothetical protein